MNPIAHGTTYSEAHRCRRARKKTVRGYCPPCQKVVSAHIKERYHLYKDKRNLKRRIQRKEEGHLDWHKRRARKAGVPREHYTRQQLLERDGYTCYLCHTPVDLTAPHVVGQPGWETYPHVDHVIPISKGGHDTLDNVRIAHARCNLEKKDKLPDFATAWFRWH